MSSEVVSAKDKEPTPLENPEAIVVDPKPSATPLQKHEQFYFDDGNVEILVSQARFNWRSSHGSGKRVLIMWLRAFNFQVQDRLYRVHSFLLALQSKSFLQEHVSDTNKLVHLKASRSSFDAFLEVLYHSYASAPFHSAM